MKINILRQVKSQNSEFRIVDFENTYEDNYSAHESFIIENCICVQIKIWFWWHTIKSYQVLSLENTPAEQYCEDLAYANLCAEELLEHLIKEE